MREDLHNVLKTSHVATRRTALQGLTPDESISKDWQNDPQRMRVNPTHHHARDRCIPRSLVSSIATPFAPRLSVARRVGSPSGSRVIRCSRNPGERSRHGERGMISNTMPSTRIPASSQRNPSRVDWNKLRKTPAHRRSRITIMIRNL